MRTPPVDAPSITGDSRSPVEQLEALLRDHPKLRRRYFGVLAAVDTLADAEPWIRAARSLHERAVIDEDGWVYFAAMFLECLTFGDNVSDPELVRIQHEIDTLDQSERAIRNEDDYDADYDAEGSPELRQLFAAYDSRARVYTAECLRELGYRELADDVEFAHEAFLDRTEVGVSKLFDE